MEVLTKDTEISEDVARGVAGVLEGRIIELVPVPYGGDERAVTVIQPPMDRFMVEKPA